MAQSSITITCAPCCWGVDDVNNPHLPAWETVLDEAASAGFGGLELGPYGYMPLDATLISSAIKKRNLSIIAGTIFDDLISQSNLVNLTRQTREICALITQLPKPKKHEGQRYDAPYLTVMDWGHDERDYAAGHAKTAPRLNDEAWSTMMENIHAIGRVAKNEFGVRTVIHPHAGGYIEFEDELERLVKDLDPNLAGLCLDTGHMLYSGMDPVSTLDRHWDKVDYIHFKDIDASIYEEIMGEKIRFFDACAKGVMCPIGQGEIDYKSIFELLEKRGYGGYITIEQERDPRNTSSVLSDLAKSRAFLQQF